MIGQLSQLILLSCSIPQAGKEAIRAWKPHLVYVQGGNTFWLHHCMEKGDWEKDLIYACGYNSESNSNSDDSSFSAVYCGVSAGSILAGESMQTACWKVSFDFPFRLQVCHRIFLRSYQIHVLCSFNRNGMIHPLYLEKKHMTIGKSQMGLMQLGEFPGFLI